MKKLLTILLILITINSFGQSKSLNEDKINHFSCGYIIGFTGNCIAYEVTKNKTVGLVSGVLASSLAGYLKENYDKNNGRYFDKNDLKATVLGGLGGTLTIRIILGNSIHRKRATMEQYFLIDNTL